MINSFFNFFDLHQGEDDKDKVLENVKENITFRGANLWILACAIVIASIGLNVNSAAVVIGAMLISPLMSPIVGAGFSLGIYDFNLLKKSLSNLLKATVIGLVFSTIYFFLSPFKEIQSELLARTSPTIYDVLIAFIGGLVGVIAITRKEKGNPIPGVAIATALMPPLCTAGYGLAIGNMNYFFGALFLYTINCVFICISTYAIVKFLKYPSFQFVDKSYQRRIRYGISFLVIAMILPSIYFAYRLLEEKKFNQKVDNFINAEFNIKGYALVIKKVELKSKTKKIELAFLNKKFSPVEVNTLQRSLIRYGIKNTALVIKQDTTDIKNAILSEIYKNKSNIDQKDLRIAQLENRIANNKFDNKVLFEELSILYPTIRSISISNHQFTISKDSIKTIPVMIYSTTKPLTKGDKAKISEWLAKRLNKEKVEIFSEQIINKSNK
ncbi:TIGR00341 family protein [Flavobacterium sp.]